MSGTRTIFLDLDGPLLDGGDRHYFCYEKIMRGLSRPPVSRETYWSAKRRMIDRRELLELSGAADRYDAFLAQWLEIIETADALALDKVQPGALECLAEWRAKGVRLVLATLRANPAALEAQLVRTGLRPWLDAVLVCRHESGGEGKAARVRQALPDETFRAGTWWIGDTEADWRAAQSLGCPVLLVSNGLRTAEYLSGLAGGRVVRNITEAKAVTDL